MSIYFQIAGGLCVLYYCLLAVYSRRLNSTFSVFWLISGGVHLILGCAPFPDLLYRVICLIYLFAAALFLITELQIILAMRSGRDPGCEWIVVLGAQVRGKKITGSLRRRLDSAAAYMEEHPGSKAVVSGGQGRGEEISEAEAMAEYLMNLGIEKDRIFLEDKSTSTRENLRFSKKIMKDSGGKATGIVTNNFHIYRAALIAGQEGYEKIFRIPASSAPVYQLNYLVREFFGVMHVRVNSLKNRL